MSTLAVSKFNSLQGWRVKGGVRNLMTTWELLYNEASSKNRNYRLIIDLDEQTYFVRREVVAQGFEAQQVDYLKNLRTKGEQKRRAQQEVENLGTLEEEFREDDFRQGAELDKLFFETIFADSGSIVRLARPLAFPKLAEPTILPEGLVIESVKVRGKTYTDGQPFIRISGRTGSDFAVIKIKVGEDQELTMVNDPGTGTFRLAPGNIDYEWSLDKR